jgi:hypothetical protein
MPYFEGDFWPNILEESIKELEQEEMEKRRREEEEAAADTDDGESSVSGDRVEVSCIVTCFAACLMNCRTTRSRCIVENSKLLIAYAFGPCSSRNAAC